VKTFIDFGVCKKKTKKVYESLSGDLYDFYMLGRYFKDIHNLDNLINKKIIFSKELLHDTKDLKFNLINFLLILENKKKKFYEFGFTLYEKIFYFKLFKMLLNQKLDIKKIEFFGNEISEKFIFFSKNFYKDYKLHLSKKLEGYSFSVFFSKGITLLYEKNNIKYIEKFVKNCDAGSFDISIYPRRKKKILETGYALNYPSFKDFRNIVKNSNKYFFYRNKSKIGNKLYLEIIFGKKNLGVKINKSLNILKYKKKISSYKKYLSLNQKFKKLDLNVLN
jgi:hypothetical protein